MAFESDGTGPLPPLRVQGAPGIPVETLLSVESVTLGAGDVPWGILREFYRRVLGLKVVGEDGERLRMRHVNRGVVLERGYAGVGQLGLLVRNFSDALTVLKQRQVAHQILHGDAGFSRTAILRDPAGNWVHLVETRPL